MSNNRCEIPPGRVHLLLLSTDESVSCKSYTEAAARKGNEQWTEVRLKKLKEKPIYGEKQPKDDDPKFEVTTSERLWRLYVGNLKANSLTQNVETYCAKFGIDVRTIKVISNQDENNADKAVAMKLELVTFIKTLFWMPNFG